MHAAADVTLLTMGRRETFPPHPVGSALHLVESATNPEMSARDASVCLLDEPQSEILWNYHLEDSMRPS